MNIAVSIHFLKTESYITWIHFQTTETKWNKTGWTRLLFKLSYGKIVWKNPKSQFLLIILFPFASQLPNCNSKFRNCNKPHLEAIYNCYTFRVPYYILLGEQIMLKPAIFIDKPQIAKFSFHSILIPSLSFLSHRPFLRVGIFLNQRLTL